MTEARQQEQKSPNFKKITYKDKRQINYMSDMQAMGPHYVSFLESLNYNEVLDNVKQSHFDSIASELQRRILKQGYVDKPSKITKKGKKADTDDNFYNGNDVFINDDECCIEKKDKFSTFQDYQAVAVKSIEELYSHPMYTKKVEDIIVEVGKRKAPEQFSLNEEEDIEKFDQIRKNIRMNILSKRVQEPQADKNITLSPKIQQKALPAEDKVVKQGKEPQVIVINEDPDDPIIRFDNEEEKNDDK